MIRENLDIYLLDINLEDEDSGVFAVSLVKNPAIKKSFQAFSENKQQRFTADATRRIISGAIMIPDELILRGEKDDQGKMHEYYVTFTADSISKIAQKFFKNQFVTEVTLEHKAKVDGVYMFESLLIDASRGITAPTGYGLKDGAWWGSWKVDNDKVWDEYINEGIFTGFSVEGLFKHIPLDKKSSYKNQLYSEIIDLIDQAIANGTK